MANRLLANRLYSYERDRKMVSARVSFGATGAPTLDGPNSLGVLSVTRQSAGLFTIAFGFSGGGANVAEPYIKPLNFEAFSDVSYLSAVASTIFAVALLRNDVDTGINLPAPTGGAAGAVGSGGTFAAGTYFWKVTAVDNKMNESLASAEFQQTLVLNGSANLTWNAVPGAAFYRVYRGSATGAENVVYTNILTNSFTDTNAATQASAANQVQARPPVAACSVTLQMVNAAGAATDPANGEAMYLHFDLGDYSGA